MYRENGILNGGQGRAFGDVRASPGTQRLENFIVLLEGSQHDNIRIREFLPDVPDSFDAGHAGQADVEQQHVDLWRPYRIDSFFQKILHAIGHNAELQSRVST